MHAIYSNSVPCADPGCHQPGARLVPTSAGADSHVVELELCERYADARVTRP
jgi:hypothetical protein